MRLGVAFAHIASNSVLTNALSAPDRMLGWIFLRLALRRPAYFLLRRRVQAQPDDIAARLLALECLVAEGFVHSASAFGRTIPADIDVSPKLRRRARRLSAILGAGAQTRCTQFTAFDAFIEFLADVRAMILRDLLLLSKTNLFASLTSPIRVVANTLGHAYLYLLVIRPVPPGTSFLTFCMPVFIIWQAFDHAFYYADPNIHKWRSQDEIQHYKWLHAFAAMVGWDMVSTAFVCTAIFVAYDVTGETLISRPLNFDSLPLFIGMYWLAVAMGLGIGAIHHYCKKLLPALDVIGKLMAFVLYLTSGVYDSYASEPAAMREVFVLNPLLPVMEYSRKAFASNYYVADLNLWYSIAFTAVSLFIGLILLKKMIAEADH